MFDSSAKLEEGEEVPSKRRKLHPETELKSSNNNYLHNLTVNSTLVNNIAVRFIEKTSTAKIRNNQKSIPSQCSLVEVKTVIPSVKCLDNNDATSKLDSTRRNSINSCEECRSYTNSQYRKSDPGCIVNDPFLNDKNQLLLDGLSFKALGSESLIIKNTLQKHSITSGFVGVGLNPGIFIPGILLGIMESGCGFYPMNYKRPISDSYKSRSILRLDWIIVDFQFLRSNILEDDSQLISISSLHKIEFNLDDSIFVCFLVKLGEISANERISKVQLSPFKYAYAMRTTGTTGNRRIVLVPHQAIVTNVLDFIQIFKVSAHDTILSIAPITFDPSIIDLFIAFGTGANFIQLADNIRLIPPEVVKIILEYKVTILQCTPSFIRRFDKSLLRSTVFDSQASHLRILALGGEKCLSKSYLREIIPPAMQVSLNVFNLFGVTEISCWASASLINLSKVETPTAGEICSDDVSIGNPLSFTTLQILPSAHKNCDTTEPESEGEILIGYEDIRECLVFNEKYGTVIEPFKLDLKQGMSENAECKYKYFQTGDLARKIKNKDSSTGEESTSYYFVRRIDRIRKRNGIKIDLEEIENAALRTAPFFSLAICIDYDQKILLLLKLQDNQFDKNHIVSELHSRLKSTLYFENHPDRIIFFSADQQLPINGHGKLDVKRILKAAVGSPGSNCEKYNSATSDANVLTDPSPPISTITKSYIMNDNQFEQIFNTLWNFNTRRIPTLLPPADTTDCFLACGGNSISANRFVEEFFDKIGKFGDTIHIENEKFLITQLLSRSYDDAKASFDEIRKKANYHCQFTIVHEDMNESYVVENESVIRAGFDGKDVYKDIVNGKATGVGITSLKSSPGSTICRTLAFPIGLCVDATPVIAPHPIHGHICVIGSHSGSVHAFGMSELARYLETLSLSVSTWTSTSTYCPKEHSEAAGVGKLPALVWHQLLPDRIESTITIHSSHSSGYFGYLGCHDGRLYKISTENGNIEWSFCCDTEIRSSPAVSQDGTSVVFATPHCVYCIDANSGTIRWRQSVEYYILQTCSVILSVTSVFLSTVNGILALFLKDGRILWGSTHKNICTTPLLVENKNMIVFGDRSGSIFALDQISGNLVWDTSKMADIVRSPPNYLVYHQCSFKKFHSEDGDDGFIIYSTHDGTVVCLGPNRGNKVFRTRIGQGKECRSKPFVVDITTTPDSDLGSETSASEGISCIGSPSATDELAHQRQNQGQERCCCFINSQDGAMFSILLEFDSLECEKDKDEAKDMSLEHCVTRELFHFGQDGAESFSSPAFDSCHKILAVGSRDNCVHFAMLP